MNPLEEQLLKEETGGAEPRFILATGTRIDTGRWWRRSPVWLCLVGDELVLLAVGRRRYLERIAVADCPDTHYNPAAGELVIEPGETLRFPRLRMPMADALNLLELTKDHVAKTHP